jgi:tetratricopeptide (TPR) repeat protein
MIPVLLALLVAEPHIAPEDVRPPLERAGKMLAGGQAHAYRIVLREGEALFGMVTQRGVDVVVTVRDPKSTVAIEVDSPNGTAGPEPVAFVARASGTHVIEIKALEAQAESGQYDLKLEALRPATGRDRGLSEALVRHAQAMKARNEALRVQSQARYEPSNRLYAEAHREAGRALALRQTYGPPLDVAATHQLLGLIDDEVGDYVTGKAHFTQALRILEKELGSAHPGTLTTRSDLGYLAVANGDWQEAEQLFTSVLERREQLVGPDHPSLANGMVGLGEALRRLGKLERSEEVLRRGLAIRAKAAGVDHPSLAWFWLNLGEVQAARGRFEEAELLCTRAKTVADARPESSRLHLASAHACLGKIRLAQGDTAAAVGHLQEALRIREAAGGPDHPWTAQALTELGRALGRAGRTPEGREALKRAQRIYEKRLRPGHPALEETRQALVDLGLKSG